MQITDIAPTWPDTTPTEILPGLCQGGTSESSHLDMPAKAEHHWGGCPFDLIITLYADAQPAPWGVEEIRFGFPDAALNPADLARLKRIATYASERWRAGARVLVRCQAGVNRSGLVVGLILARSGWDPETAIDQMRAARSPWVLSNEHFVAALYANA